MNISLSPSLVEAVAIVRQRSQSNEIFPEPKRSKRISVTSSPSASDLAALNHWRQQQQLNSIDDSGFSSNYDDELRQLEQLVEFQSQCQPQAPPTLERQHYASPDSLPDLSHGKSSVGISTSPTRHFPTPATTPQLHHAHGTPRPSLRSSTLPHPSGPHQTNLAYANANILGRQRECRVGGSMEEVDSAKGATENGNGIPVRRSTDGGASLVSAAVKDHLVTGLVGATVIAIESIWGTGPQPDPSGASALPLHWFVKEVLRRSKTSYSTLQVALFYLHKSRREIREIVARANSARQERAAKKHADIYASPPLSPVDLSMLNEDRFDSFLELQSSPLLCGRRMFLASLVAASKYLQDRNYSNRAWSKIAGLPVKEINDNERIFLNLMKFQLHLSADDFQRWTERLGTLASQGAAREASQAKMDAPARFGLVRTQSELPDSAHHMQDIVTEPAPPLPTTAPRPPSSSLGRTLSDPSIVNGAQGLMRKVTASPIAQKKVAPVLPPTPPDKLPAPSRQYRAIPLRARAATNASTLRPNIQWCAADAASIPAWAAPNQVTLAH